MGGHHGSGRPAVLRTLAALALLAAAGICARDASASSTPPVITALSPTSGPVGSTLTIKGSSMSGATDVHFVGGDVHTTPTVLSAAKLTATVPAGAQTGPVEVTTPRGGTARSSTPFVVVGGPPAITAIDPTSGVAGTTLTVTGSGLANALSVTIGGAPATVTSIDPSGTRLTAVVPSPAPSGQVVVTTPLGSATSTQSFTATSPTGIDSFSPTSGAPGTVVTIAGPNLGSATDVRFSGQNAVASPITVVSPQSIRVAVPTAAATGPITVTTPSGSATSSTVFTVPPPPTAIDSFSPDSGQVGTIVTLIGPNLASATEDRISGTNAVASPITIVSPSSIQVAVPTTAATGPITVTTPSGSATSSSSFTVLPPPATIDSFSPTAGAPGTIVTIDGQNVGFASEVRFSGTNAVASPITVVSSHTIQVPVPPTAVTGPITVTTSLFGSATSSASFTVPPPTTIDSFSPTTGGPGTTVTINGSNVGLATEVRFSGTNAVASPITVLSPQSIRVSVPLAAATGPITVTTPYGTATSSSAFTVPPPSLTIDSFSPTRAPAGSTVTILGSGFDTVKTVRFSGDSPGTSAPFTIVSPHEIVATVTAQARSGLIQVYSATTYAASSDPFLIPLTITSISPGGGLPGDDIRITGTGFLSVTEVDFGDVPAADFSRQSSTVMDATVPDGFEDGPITIKEYYGQTATSAQTFGRTTITGFSPDIGAPNGHVVITGRHLEAVTEVLFRGGEGPMESPSFDVSADGTSIDAVIPPPPGNDVGALDGPISLMTQFPDKTTSADSFRVVAVDNYTPRTAKVGDPVTIVGSHLDQATAVVVDGAHTDSFVVDPAGKSLTTTVPPDAGGEDKGQVIVETSNGSAAAPNGGLSIQPTITDFTPKYGPPGTRITVTGTGLRAVVSVLLLGGQARASTVSASDDGTQLVFTVPNIPPEVAGTIELDTVGSGARTTDQFRLFGVYLLNRMPGAGGPIGRPGDEVNIEGWELEDASGVDFNGTPSPSFTWSGWRGGHATIPAGATTGRLHVTTPLGTATSSQIFYVVSVDGFFPTTGPPGTPVVISGSGFLDLPITSVTVGGGSVPFTVLSGTQIAAVIDADAKNGPIVLHTAVGDAASLDSYAVERPTTVDSFMPDNGVAGTMVTIDGWGVDTATEVRFSGSNAVTSAITVVSQGEIMVPVPPTAATGPITVTTPAGSAASSSDFTVPVPPAAIDSFSPDAGLVGSTVTLDGPNVGSASEVRFSGQNAVAGPITILSQRSIRVAVPSAAVSGPIVVETPVGTATSSGDFTVLPPSATIDSFSPGTGRSGTVVVIDGQNLGSATEVRFSGTNAVATPTPDVLTPTAIQATVPPTAQTGPITVTTSLFGSVTSSYAFTVSPKTAVVPTLVGSSPLSGAADGGKVTLTGTHLEAVTGVDFPYYYVYRAKAPSFYILPGGNQLVATLPPNATDGRVDVTTADGTRLEAPTPFMHVKLTSYYPIEGRVGSQVTVTGVNLHEVTSVAFGGASTTDFLVDAPGTHLTVSVPALADNGNFQIRTANGAVTGSNFRVDPTLTDFSPKWGVPGTRVHLRGTGFTAVRAFSFDDTHPGDITRATVSADGTRMDVTVPPDAADHSDSVGIILYTKQGEGGTSEGHDFKFFLIRSLNRMTNGGPNGKPGDKVEIMGANLDRAGEVRFNGRAATFSYESSGVLQAVVPDGATTGPVEVTTPLGTVVSPMPFTVTSG